MSEARASSLAEQLQRGFHGLRFDGELESAYRRDQFHDRLRYLRINLAILAAISLTVIQIDHVVMPVIGRIVPDLARTGVMLPLLLIGFALTFLGRADAWYPRYMAVAMTIALMAIAWIGLTAWSGGEPRLFVRFVIATRGLFRRRPVISRGRGGECDRDCRLCGGGDRKVHAGAGVGSIPVAARGRKHHLRGWSVQPGTCPADRLARGSASRRDCVAGRPDWNPQPAPVRRSPPACLGAEHPRAEVHRAAVRGHRSFQAVQRPLRPPGGRRGAQGCRRGPRAFRAPAARPRGALRRRGVRDRAVRHDPRPCGPYRRGDHGGRAGAGHPARGFRRGAGPDDQHRNRLPSPLRAGAGKGSSSSPTRPCMRPRTRAATPRACRKPSTSI